MKQVQYDEETYQVDTLPTGKALSLLTKITKITGSSIGRLVSVGDNDGFDKVLPIVIQEITERMDEENVLLIVKGLISSVTKDNKQVMFESEFKGRLGTLLKLCKDSMEVNYSGFLKELQNSAL